VGGRGTRFAGYLTCFRGNRIRPRALIPQISSNHGPGAGRRRRIAGPWTTSSSMVKETLLTCASPPRGRGEGPSTNEWWFTAGKERGPAPSVTAPTPRLAGRRWSRTPVRRWCRCAGDRLPASNNTDGVPEWPKSFDDIEAGWTCSWDPLIPANRHTALIDMGRS